MKIPARRISFAAIALLATGALITITTASARQGAQGVTVGASDVGGTVTGASGPEAGVWVIAETKELQTPYAKIVVTDDRGRYLIPGLPKANYDIWVRGYGLVDSPKSKASPGQRVDLRAVTAPNAKAAAHYYPAGYWFSMIKVPAASEFPGTGPGGNGINPAVANQTQWLRMLKSTGCWACHQLGSLGTRSIPRELGAFASHGDAWRRRVLSGQAGGQMSGALANFGEKRVIEMFADWTQRIEAGELPPAPPRPQGVERNVVITVWDWADPKAYLHDVVSTDRRKPTVNANGPVYGALELSQDYAPVLDPRTHTASKIPLTVRDPATPPATPQTVLPAQSSPYWGTEAIWNSKNNVHNPMLDGRGRLWLTSAVRPAENPPICRAGSEHPSAKLTPNNRASRHLAMYDPATKKLTHIGTCFGTHHLMFAEDANNTLWTSGGGAVVGWLNTKMFDETGDEEKSQGWTALILDTNGDGKRGEHVEANLPVDPAKDKRITNGLYSVAPAPDGSVWGTSLTPPHGSLIRITPGANPPHTTLAEIFEPPMDEQGMPIGGFSPRGGDVDRNGVFWAAMASGHLASFDRRKCKGPLNGPRATGQHCPEGWTFFAEPLPQMQNVTTGGSAEASYYTWVDQFNTLGLGANIPINTGNAAEGLLALKDGKFVTLRVPYPLGFFTKWMDGRIDDPNAGWKGRGIWATVSTRAPFHMEGGKGTTSKVMKFQLRPDPLAR
jgi:hypothetical protein